jgi:hypothetical protein
MQKNYVFAPLLAALFLLVSVAAIQAQDLPVSLGPAPQSTIKMTQEPTPFQVGTRAFTQLSVGGTTFQFGKTFLESCTPTNIGAPFAITFPGGLLYRNGVVYTYNQSSPFQMWSIDTTTGTHTLVFSMTGAPQTNLTGMYWDGTNVYGVSSSLAVSQIFTVNMTNGVCTPIGSASATCAGAIFLTGRYGTQYSAFSVDIVLDNLYKWNKSTGVATLVGPLGGNANYGQDADFDNTDNKLYWMSYTTGPELRTIDTATGTAGAVLCSYTAQATGIVMPVVAGPPPQHDYAAGPFLGLTPTYPINTLANIRAKITNNGTSNETSVPIKFFVDGSQVGSSINLSLNAGQVDSVSFPWTPTVGGNHNIRIVSALATDVNRGNDTVQANVLVLSGTPTVGGTINACRTGLNINITDNASIFDSVQVTIPAWAFGIQDVNAEITELWHTWDSDLTFTLSHGGTSVIIISAVGGSGDNFIGTILNDSATTPIASGTAPFTGSFIPSNPLAAFNGIGNNPNGYWKLEIHDGAGGDTGYLHAWCVKINYYTFVGGIGSITIPNFYALGQNYPNPFNPATKIQYAIPKAGDVSLVVYDILGRQVATLVNEFKNPGVYTIDFNASSLSSGVYFYKIQSGTFTDTKKMLLVK